jgi:hypothetical protein
MAAIYSNSGWSIRGVSVAAVIAVAVLAGFVIGSISGYMIDDALTTPPQSRSAEPGSRLDAANRQAAPVNVPAVPPLIAAERAAAESKAADSKAAESKAAESKVVESQAAESQATQQTATNAESGAAPAAAASATSAPAPLSASVSSPSTSAPPVLDGAAAPVAASLPTLWPQTLWPNVLARPAKAATAPALRAAELTAQTTSPQIAPTQDDAARKPPKRRIARTRPPREFSQAPEARPLYDSYDNDRYQNGGQYGAYQNDADRSRGGRRMLPPQPRPAQTLFGGFSSDRSGY